MVFGDAFAMMTEGRDVVTMLVYVRFYPSPGLILPVGLFICLCCCLLRITSFPDFCDDTPASWC